MNFIDIFRALDTKAAFFSSAYGIFSRIGHMLGHKASLNKFKKIEIMSSDNVMKLEINHRKKTEKRHKDLKAK